MLITLLLVTAFSAVCAMTLWESVLNFRREKFIREYVWPPQLLRKLELRHSGFRRKESALVASGLRQFFLSYHMSGYKLISMPSQVADDLWHEFILYTRDYQDFCKGAFGRFLHHTPAVRLSSDQKADNEGLRRAWLHCCQQENIDYRAPSRLPLLFALDTKFKIANGFVYVPDCAELRRGGNYGGQCGGDFSSSSIDGGTDGLDGDGDGGGDGGCGGGCGGD